MIIVTDPLVAGVEGRLLNPGEQLVLDSPNSHERTFAAFSPKQKMCAALCLFDDSLIRAFSPCCHAVAFQDSSTYEPYFLATVGSSM